jgi:hypothetical protein
MALMSLIVNGAETLTAPVVATVPFASMIFNSAGTPTNYATIFNAAPEVAAAGIVFDADMARYQSNSTKPFTAGFWQGPTPDYNPTAPYGRIEFVGVHGTAVGDSFDYWSGTLTYQQLALTINAGTAQPGLFYPAVCGPL